MSISQIKERIKEHVGEHLIGYSVGVSVVVAGFTALIMRERHARMQSVPDGSARITMRPLSIFSNGQATTFVSVAEREGRGHPGYVVRSLETGHTFMTQGEAAKAFGISPSALSSHLNDKFDNVNGLHFERVSLGA